MSGGSTTPHLVLVGLPGVGKSTVGRLLAERLGRPFVDFDLELERRFGMPVADIFARHGEGAFRDAERALTAEFRERAGHILAPGGGWIEQPGVVAMLRPPARLVYLRATPACVLRRMGASRADRPLLAGPDPLGRLQALAERRGPLYGAADVVVDAEDVDAQQLTARVMDLISL